MGQEEGDNYPPFDEFERELEQIDNDH